MNVLSLFDGMSCGQIALIEIGIKPDKYYASEIDKYAISQSKLNFPDMIHLGSVVDVDVSKLEPINLLIGGSPCQSFSFAGKRKGMSTKCSEEIYTLEKYLELKEQGFEFEGQSYLFWEYMRILNDIRKYNPNVKFLLENVEMGAKWERVLSEAIGVFGVHINSALVSAQNRKRIYWTNIRTKSVGLFGELHSDIPQPKDRGILLKDILESEVDEKYYISEKALMRAEGRKWSKPQVNPEKTGCLSTVNNSGRLGLDSGTTFVVGVPDKSYCIDANYFKGTTVEQYLSKSRRQLVQDDAICVAMRGRGENNEQQLEPREGGKTNCLTSVQKDNLVFIGGDYRSDEGFRPRKDGKMPTLTRGSDNSGTQYNALVMTVNYAQFDISGKGYKSQQDRAFYDSSKHGCLSGSRAGTKEKVLTQSRIRRLTPTECARLQTIPDWYKWECSDTQQYKMLGNGWTVEVIKHILSFLDFNN